MHTVGLHGAFSIANTGDQLLQLATRRALAEEVPGWRIELSAPALRGSIWRHRWDEERGLGQNIARVPAQDFDRWPGWASRDALVLGGGGLLSADPAFGAFFPRVEKPVAWNAVGFHHSVAIDRLAGPALERIAASAADARYSSVRDARSAEVLRGAGVRVEVVPDPCLGLTLEGADPDAAPARRRIGISPGPATLARKAFGDRLFAALDRLRRQADLELVCFPFTPLYGDERMAALAAERLPGATHIPSLGTVEAWRLVGRLDGYLATRYHGAVAALAQGVPLLVLDEYRRHRGERSKHTELLDGLGLGDTVLLPFDDEDDLEGILARWLDTLGQAPAPAAVEAARQRLRRHWRRLAKALGAALGDRPEAP